MFYETGLALLWHFLQFMDPELDIILKYLQCLATQETKYKPLFPKDMVYLVDYRVESVIHWTLQVKDTWLLKVPSFAYEENVTIVTITII